MGELLTILVTTEHARGLDPDIVRPGWLALGIVTALGVGVFLLSKSFARHTRRAAQPWEGDEDEASAPTPTDAATTGSGTTDPTTSEDDRLRRD